MKVRGSVQSVFAPTQIEHRCELTACKTLLDFKNGFLGIKSFGDVLVAVFTIFKREIVRRNGIPKLNPAQRLQPLDDVLDVLKNNHAMTIPNHWFETQILEADEIS